MRIKTSKIKSICETFSKIIVSDKIRPITALVELYSADNILHMGMTDNNTRVVATMPSEDEPLDNVVINMDNLKKLVSLTTTEYVSLTVKDDYVEFKGNGKYKLPITLDEVGNEIHLSLSMPNHSDIKSYQTSDIILARNRNKQSLYTGEGNQELYKYYYENGNIITSDSITVAVTHGELFDTELYPDIIDKLSGLPTESLDVSIIKDGYRITSGIYELYIRRYNVSRFPIDDVRPFIDANKNTEMFPVKLEIEKTLLTNAIKRQNLFKTTYDIPSVILTISDECVKIENTKKSVEEVLEASIIYNNDSFSVEVSTEVLLASLHNMVNGSLQLYAGKDAICIEDDNGLYVISVLEKD